jgi:hypothetical protein
MTGDLKSESEAPVPIISNALFFGNLIMLGLRTAAHERFKQQFGR